MPTLTQKRELPFAFGMLGVADAESSVRFTLTLHGSEADPQVFAAVHIWAGFGSAQTSLSFFDWAAAVPDSNDKASSGAEKVSAVPRWIFIVPRKSTLSDSSKEGYQPTAAVRIYERQLEQRDESLVDASGSRPVQDIDEFPGVLCEVPLQLPCVTKHELGSRVRDSRALALVLVIDLDHARSEIE